MLDRQTLTNSLVRDFQDYPFGYWITLNTHWHVLDHADRRTITYFDYLDPKVSRFIHRLNQKCFGRRYARKEQDARLKCLAAFEVGASDGLIHCHILAAHDGSVRHELDDVRRIAHEEWEDIYESKGGRQFVHVDPLENARDRIWYMTKRSEAHQRLYRGALNITSV